MILAIITLTLSLALSSPINGTDIENAIDAVKSLENTPKHINTTGICTRPLITAIGTVPSSCPNGMEKSGLLCYPPCPQNLTGNGPLCSNGVKIQGRGVGVPMVCKKSMRYHWGLCYPKCSKGYVERGRSCIMKCPKDMYPCDRICYSDVRKCEEFRLRVFGRVFGVVDNAVGDGTNQSGMGWLGWIARLVSNSIALAIDSFKSQIEYPSCKL